MEIDSFTNSKNRQVRLRIYRLKPETTFTLCRMLYVPIHYRVNSNDTELEQVLMMHNYDSAANLILE